MGPVMREFWGLSGADIIIKMRKTFGLTERVRDRVKELEAMEASQGKVLTRDHVLAVEYQKLSSAIRTIDGGTTTR